MDDKRMIGDYTVLNSMYVGHKEIAICENPQAAKDERYLCCYIENVIVFERYTEALVSDDFAEIAQVFGERISAAAEEIIKETEKANEQIGANAELMSARRTKPSMACTLRRAHRRNTRQIVFQAVWKPPLMRPPTSLISGDAKR